MMIWLYALVIGIAFVIQFVLSSKQMSQFNKEFVALRRKGKVLSVENRADSLQEPSSCSK